MFYSNIKVLSYPLLFTSMLTLSFATDTLRRVTANPEWFATVLEASMQRIAACEDTDPAPQSSSPELQTCSFASAFEPQLCRLAEFQHHCSNFMDKIGSYIPPINLQSYISTLGQQFNAAFFSALQSIPPAEITAIRALKQSYSKFYLIGIISYGRRHLVPRSRKAAFPSNLASNFCIECPISFRRFLNENRQKISNTFDRIIKSLEESELKTICTERLYMQQMWRIEKKFNKLFMVENKKTAATASLTPSTPPLTTAANKERPAKRRKTTKRPTGHPSTSKTVNGEPTPPLSLPTQHIQLLLQNSEPPQTVEPPKQDNGPHTYRSFTWGPSQLTRSKHYLSQELTLPTGEVIFINSGGAVFYGDPLKAKVALPEHLEKVRKISSQLFALWRSTQISLDDYQQAYFSLDTILHILENNFALCNSQLVKFLRGIESADDNDIEKIFRECQRRRIPAHEYAEQIYSTLKVAYEFALENNMLVDFFTSAFKAPNLPGTTAVTLPHESLEDWFKRSSAMLEIYDSYPLTI